MMQADVVMMAASDMAVIKFSRRRKANKMRSGEEKGDHGTPSVRLARVWRARTPAQKRPRIVYSLASVVPTLQEVESGTFGTTLHTFESTGYECMVVYSLLVHTH
jgi:hypothetical protein